MTDRRISLGLPEPPESWPVEVRAHVKELQQAYIGSEEVGTEMDFEVATRSMERNMAIHGLCHILMIDISPADAQVAAQVASMTTLEIVTETERTKRALMKRTVRELIESHPPLPADILEQLRAFPIEMRSALPDKFQMLMMALKEGVYDELIAEGMVAGSRMGDDVTQSNDMLRMRAQYQPFSGATVSLNELFAAGLEGKDPD